MPVHIRPYLPVHTCMHMHAHARVRMIARARARARVLAALSTLVQELPNLEMPDLIGEQVPYSF